jgi:repressor LexA
MSVNGLTHRQRATILFIRECVQSRGYPPTIREIGEHVGLSSTSSVHFMLEGLIDRGIIKREPGKPRAISVTNHPVLEEA